MPCRQRANFDCDSIRSLKNNVVTQHRDGRGVRRTHRSELPVSKCKFITCGGVPISTGHKYKESFIWSWALTSPFWPSSSTFLRTALVAFLSLGLNRFLKVFAVSLTF